MENLALPKNGKKLSMMTRGKFEVHNNNVHITELPIGTWTQPYMQLLDRLENDRNSGISKVREANKVDTISITLHAKNPSFKNLHLERSYGLSNMVLLNKENRPSKYGSANEIIEAFYNERLPYYEKRRQLIMEQLTKEIAKKEMKIKFIQAYRDKKFKTRNRDKAELVGDLNKLGISGEILDHVTFTNVTKQGVEPLMKEIADLEYRKKYYETVEPQKLWIQDLEEFENAYCSHYKCPLPQDRNQTTILKVEMTYDDDQTE